MILIADITDIEALVRVEIDSKKASIPQVLSALDIDRESLTHRWQTWFRGESPQTSRPERIAFKATANGEAVGYIAGHLTIRYNRDAEIQSFYILKEHQGKGLGKCLFDRFTNWMKQYGAKSLCVGFYKDNPYKKFYLKQGGRYLNEHWAVWENL